MTVGKEVKSLQGIKATPADLHGPNGPVPAHVLQILLSNGPKQAPTQVLAIAPTAQLRILLERLLQALGSTPSDPTGQPPGGRQTH